MSKNKDRTRKARSSAGIEEPMTELGFTGLQYFGGSTQTQINEEILRQLQGGRAFRVYREMSENDPVVGAMLYALEMLVRKATWSVDPGEKNPAAEENALFIDQCMQDMSHSWADFIGEWMACPTYGFAFFETIYKQRLGDNSDPSKRSRFNDGKIGLRKLAIRHPETRQGWEFDESGGVRGYVQQTYPHFSLVTIPIEKGLLFTVNSRKGNPEGRSLLRGAYTSWYYKDKIAHIEAMGIERDLAGLPVIYVPPQLLAGSPSATDVAILNYYKQMITRIRRGEQEGVVLPAVFDENNNPLVKLELLSSGGRRQFDTSAIVTRYDQRIAMTILADVILMGHEKVGSYALSTSKSQLFTAGINALLDSVTEVLNRHLVPRLLRLNGMDTTMPPVIKHGTIEEVDLSALGDYISKLSGAGVPLFPTDDGELERELVSLANLPSDGLRVGQDLLEVEDPIPPTEPPPEPPPEPTKGPLAKIRAALKVA